LFTVDKHQRFISYIMLSTSIRREHSSSNAENSYDNFKIDDYFFQPRLRLSASQHRIMQLLI